MTTTEEPQAGEVGAGLGNGHMPSGVLGQLAQRRDEIQHDLIKHWFVPRWENPKIKIVFHPVDHEVLKRVGVQQARTVKEKDPKKIARVELDTNADVLINACVEIIAVLDDGSEVGVGPDGMVTRFDRDLAISLGLPPEAGARATCQRLFITDGDLLSMAREVAAWSGYRDDAIEEELSGES